MHYHFYSIILKHIKIQIRMQNSQVSEVCLGVYLKQFLNFSFFTWPIYLFQVPTWLLWASFWLCQKIFLSKYFFVKIFFFCQNIFLSKIFFFNFLKKMFCKRIILSLSCQKFVKSFLSKKIFFLIIFIRIFSRVHATL